MGDDLLRVLSFPMGNQDECEHLVAAQQINHQP